MACILGIDFGKKRTGFAVSDPSEILAIPHSVFEYDHPAQLVHAIQQICKEREVEKIVMGWPINMDGSIGPIAEAVQHFVDELKSGVTLPIEKWDERFSSKTAEHVLIEAGTRRKKRKKVIDKLSAQIMLQHYLDSR